MCSGIEAVGIGSQYELGFSCLQGEGSSFEKFVAEVKALRKVEREGTLCVCPILERCNLIKDLTSMEKHLKDMHKASMLACIFCKKELYAQNKVGSHNCKCPVCGYRCFNRVRVVESVAAHIQVRHSDLAAKLGITQEICDRLSDQSFVGFSSSSSLSSSSYYKVLISFSQCSITCMSYFRRRAFS